MKQVAVLCVVLGVAATNRLRHYQTEITPLFGLSRNYGSRSGRIAWLLWIGVILVLALSESQSSRAYSQDEGSLDSLAEVWKQRESLVTTARLTFKCRRLTPKGSEQHVSGSLPGEFPQIRLERESSADITITVEVDRDKIRITETGLRWESRDGRFVETDRVDLFDGELYTRYIGVTEATDRVYKAAFVSCQLALETIPLVCASNDTILALVS